MTRDRQANKPATTANEIGWKVNECLQIETANSQTQKTAAYYLSVLFICVKKNKLVLLA